MGSGTKTPRKPLSRRGFVQRSAAVAMTAASYKRVYGANERVGVGFIGYGLMGERHVVDFHAQPDAVCVGISDAHGGRMAEAAAYAGGGMKQYPDFRQLLERPEVDAVCIATPDHWHPLMTMMACAAGKDVYVEKPPTLFVREGRWMADVAKRCKRVVQVGTQQRSGPHYREAREFIQSGKLGKIVSVRMDFFRNLSPGFGNPPNTAPPAELDWDLFCGPAPMRPYNRNHGIYMFRWVWDFAGGQITNNGQHSVDIVDWYLEPKGPDAVTSFGGRRFLKDNCETPDLQEAIFEYPGWSMAIALQECSSGDGGKGLTFYGTRGTLTIGRGGYTVTPDAKANAYDRIPRYEGEHPVGGLSPKIGDMTGTWTTPIDDTSGDAREQFVLHKRNFLECIKSRAEPVSTLESAHRAATVLHLANISLRLGRRLRWDAEKEDIIGDPEASAMLERPYRAPWDAELKAIL